VLSGVLVMTINRDRDTLYMTTTAHTIIRHDITTKLTSVIAGTAGNTGCVDGSSGTKFSSPYDLATDTNGYIFVADQSNNRIRKITSLSTTNNAVITYAGSEVGYLDGTLAESQFSNPLGVAIDSSSIIYVGDSNNCVIRRIVGDYVDTLAGSSGSCGDSNNPLHIQFNSPIHMAMTDGSDYLYVTEQAENYPVRRISLTGKPLEVITLANFSSPLESIAVDTSGNLFATQATFLMSVGLSGTVVIAADLGESVRGIAYSSFDSDQPAAFFVRSDSLILKLTNLGKCASVS
jgi:hypothetical protein